LLLGTMYSALEGATTTLLAIGLAGGKAKVEYFVLSTIALAMVVLRVVIAAISRPCF
jgi:hypothetical protein